VIRTYEMFYRLSKLAIVCHAVHKAITIYYSLTDIFNEIKVKHNFGLGLISTKNTTSRSCLGYLCLVPKTLFCRNFASHINKMSQISSRCYGSVDTNRA